MRLIAAVSLGVSGVLVACATPQAYPGERRPLAEVSVIATARHSVSGGSEEVLIESIDGATDVEDWSTLYTGAELLPGEHRIGVRFASSVNPAFGLASLVASEAGDAENETTVRTLLIRMEPGAMYVVYVKRDPLQYLVATLPAARDYPERTQYPEWDPPTGAVACVPTPEDAGLLRCDPRSLGP
jgi:hypothetical protein